MKKDMKYVVITGEGLPGLFAAKKLQKIIEGNFD